jgi:hypothetical protein
MAEWQYGQYVTVPQHNLPDGTDTDADAAQRVGGAFVAPPRARADRIAAGGCYGRIRSVACPVRAGERATTRRHRSRVPSHRTTAPAHGTWQAAAPCPVGLFERTSTPEATAVATAGPSAPPTEPQSCDASRARVTSVVGRSVATTPPPCAGPGSRASCRC